MTVENISWSISTRECYRPRRGLNPQPPGLQSNGASNWATEDVLKGYKGYNAYIWAAPWENISSGHKQNTKTYPSLDIFQKVLYYCRTFISTQVRYRRAVTRPFVHLSVRPFVNNWLVSATPPTVFGQSFWNFTNVLAMACRCAYCLLIILRFFFSTFSALSTVSFYLKPL